MIKVLIPTKLDKEASELLLEKNFNVVQNADLPLSDLAKEHTDTNVLIVRSEKVTPDIIDALPNLKLVVRAGAGYNTIDTKYARTKKIDVMNTPGANSNAVAEEVIAFYLAAYRHLIKGDITTRQGLWEKKKLMGREITAKTIGIIGLGNIGQLVVKRLQGFEIKFLAFDPFISAGNAEKMGVKLCSMEEIFKEADCISLHIPENEKTKGIINNSLLKNLKDGAVLINCARSGIINEEDLRNIKKEKTIIFCNDVYPKDAPGEKSITDIADIMLPHLGASTFEANYNAAKRSAEQIIDYYEKGITTFVVNKNLPDGLDEKYQELANVITVIARAYLGKGNSPHKIETSFYGKLNPYSKWLLKPILKGLCTKFSTTEDTNTAESFLKQCGIHVENRKIEKLDKYDESMTIDLFEGDKVIKKVSIRGTITEGNLMITRINDFDKLFLDPSGHILFVEYKDKPGVIGKISTILGDNGINIVGIRSPLDTKQTNSLLTIKTEQKISERVLDIIKQTESAHNVFFVSIND